MSIPKLPPLLSVDEIAHRLELLFPEGTDNRLWLTREQAARTIYVFLYTGSIEGTGLFMNPKHVYAMTHEQATDTTVTARLMYAQQGHKPKFRTAGDPWYADTTREGVRDETIRELLRHGAVVQRPNLAPTSSSPRYALAVDFARVFEPALAGPDLEAAIAIWREGHLSGPARARAELLRRGTLLAENRTDVKLPSGMIRQLSPGWSSIITKSVVEVFAPRFLARPVVIWLSESATKAIVSEHETAAAIGLHIDVAKVLPDLILFDVEPGRELLLFVEVVATDGPMSAGRIEALTALAAGTKIPLNRVAFMTAYSDRDKSAFKKTVPTLAWNTFAWFVSEPDHLLILRKGEAGEKRTLLDLVEVLGT